MIYILLNANQYIKVEQLANKFNVSERTIWNDIYDINLLLEDNSFKNVKTVRNKGIILDFTAKEKEEIKDIVHNKIDNIYFDSNNRVFNLLLELTLTNKPVLLIDKQSEFDVSKTTIENDMKVIRTLLNNYKLKIKSKHKAGMYIEGSEHLIRLMIHDIINKYINNLNFFQKISSNSLQHSILYKFIPQNHFIEAKNIFKQYFTQDYDALYLEQIILFSLIWINRVRNQKHIDNNPAEKVEYSNEKLREYVNNLEQHFNLASNERENKYICNFLNILSKEENKWNSDWGTAQIVTIHLIDEVDNKLNLSLRENPENIFEGLYKHILSLIPRIRYEIQMYNPLTNNIKKNFPELFVVIKNFTKNTNYMDVSLLTDDEIAFICIHFLAAFSKNEQEHTLKFKALVFCNYGVATGELLKEKIQQYFDVEVIAVLNTNEKYLIDKLDVDIIFSTVPIGQTTIPFLVVDPIFTEITIQQIKTFLKENQNLAKRIPKNIDGRTQKLFKSILDFIRHNYNDNSEDLFNELMLIFNENDLEIDMKGLLPMIEDVLQEDAILLNKTVSDWREAIRMVAEPLLKKGAIQDKYIEAMISSVLDNGPYIVVGNHIALAHARPEDGVNELGLSVITLNPPIEFGHDQNDPVKIMFCLAAVDSHSHLNIMKTLAKIILDDKVVEKLIASNSAKEFQKILYEEVPL
nr:PTS sugar transporter subunit IIA [Allofustis seminis]